MNKEALRKLLFTPIHPLKLLDSVPWSALGVMAFGALAAFGLWPVIVLVPTLLHCSFDRMIDLNMALLDRWLFPLVAWASLATYALALAKALREKRLAVRALRNNPTLALFLALVVWMVANIWLTNGMTYSLLNGAGLKHESFFLHLEYFLCFLPLGLFLRSPRLKLWLLRGMAAVSVILAAFLFYLYGHLQSSPLYYDWKPSYAGIFTNINYYGYFLTVFIGLLAGLLAQEESRLWRWIYAVALILNAVALSYNNTLGAWIGSFFACLFPIAALRVRDGRFRRWTFAPLGLFAAVMCVTGIINGNLLYNLARFFEDLGLVLSNPLSERTARAGSGRWKIWLNCLKLIGQNPLVGIGFEGIHVRGLQFVGNPRPHNEFIQYALFYGIPGGLLYIASCAGLYVRAVRRRTRLDSLTLAALTAAFGYLVGSFFGLTVYNTAPYFFIMLGFGYVWTGAETKKGVANAQRTRKRKAGRKRKARKKR